MQSAKVDRRDTTWRCALPVSILRQDALLHLSASRHEVVRSSPDLRVAILRQEFREDLRDSRTLKEELLAAFPRVQELESASAGAHTH